LCAVPPGSSISHTGWESAGGLCQEGRCTCCLTCRCATKCCQNATQVQCGGWGCTKKGRVLIPIQPYIVKVTANVNCNDVDSLTKGQGDGGCVPVAWVKLDLGPIGSVKEGGVDSCLEEEQSPALAKCHTEVVLVKTCNVELTKDPAMAILKPL
jgi:hypothetical protein